MNEPDLLSSATPASGSRDPNNPTDPADRGGAPAARRPGRPSGGAGGTEQRARLIEAALALFARQGILDTSLATIAREAGVTPAMVHYYFKTRDQLIDVLIEERFLPLRAAMDGIFEAHPDDPVAALTLLTERFVEVGERHPWFPTLWVREVISEGGLLRQRMHERFGQSHQLAAQAAILRWQREGRLNPALEPTLLFQSLLGLALLPLATTRLWRNDPAKRQLGAREIARHAVALITQGIGPVHAADAAEEIGPRRQVAIACAAGEPVADEFSTATGTTCQDASPNSTTSRRVRSTGPAA